MFVAVLGIEGSETGTWPVSSNLCHLGFFFFHFVLPLSALPLSATSHFYKCWVFFRLHQTTFLKQQLLLAACFKVCLTSIHYNTFLLQVYFSCRLQLEAAILPALQEIKVLCHCISSIQCFICPHLCRWFALGVCFVRISNLSGLILVTDFRT